MASPFPGMDPFLEELSGWPDVHASLLPGIREQLAPLVAPQYYVRIEERIYLTDPEADPGYRSLVPDVIVKRQPGPGEAPRARQGAGAITAPVVIEEILDPEIHDRYIEIREARSHEIVTAIELLSPANKVVGSRGRQALEDKRAQLLQGGASWLEIDLLRAGERGPQLSGRSDYCVRLQRAGQRGALVWFVGLRDPLSTVAVPLRPPHEDVPLDLQKVLSETYDRARYADSTDYTRPVPPPPLSVTDAAWVKRTVEAWHNAKKGVS